MTGGFFSLIMLAMALYVLVGGISGKGRLYAVDGVPEEKQPQFKKILRTLYIIMGLFMALNTGLGYLRDAMYVYEQVPVEVTETEGDAETAPEATEPAAEEPAAETATEDEAPAAEEPAAEAEAPAAEEPAAEAPAAEEAEPATEEAAASTAATVSYELVRSDKFPNINIAYKTLNTLAIVMLGITMAAVVGMFIVIRKFVDKEEARKAQEKRAAEGGGKGNGRRGDSAGSSMPSSAFEFDDEPGDGEEKEQ